MARTMKDSGVAWVGEIPTSWEIVRFKNLMLRKSKKLAPTLLPGAISFGRVVQKDDDKIADETRATYQEVLAGEILINPINLNYDLKSLRTALSEENVCVSPAYIVARPRRSLSKVYLKNLLYCFDIAHMKTLGAGVRQTITFEDIGNSIAVVPPSNEQRAIADYLDQQTALIDQRLSTLEAKKSVLAELRKATIHEAVTKGLNKNAPMKDSGVAWIGEIPEDWQASPFKNNLLFMSRGAQPIYASDTDCFITNQSCLSTYQMRQEKKKECEPLTGVRGRYKCGDVLVASTGEGVLGKCVLSEELGYCDSHVSILRAKNAATGKFIFYWLSANYETVNSLFAKGSTKQTEFQKEAFLAFKIGFPPLAEQFNITNHLDQQTQQIDAQLATLDEQAQVLKELRKAIIHEAVTGKLPSPASGGVNLNTGD